MIISNKNASALKLGRKLFVVPPKLHCLFRQYLSLMPLTQTYVMLSHKGSRVAPNHYQKAHTNRFLSA